MAGSTPILSLRTPAGSDQVDVELDITENLEALDTFVGAGVPVPVTLTDGATVNLDASLGRLFRLTAAGDRTLAAPTNPSDGQAILVEHTASGSSRTLTLTTGAGGFLFGTDITGPLTATTSGATDIIGAIYNLAADRWRVCYVAKGF